MGRRVRFHDLIYPSKFSDYDGSSTAETTLTSAVENGTLQLQRRLDTRITLTPADKDGFGFSLGLIRFIRAARGRITQLNVRQDRAYDLRFNRTAK